MGCAPSVSEEAHTRYRRAVEADERSARDAKTHSDDLEADDSGRAFSPDSGLTSSDVVVSKTECVPSDSAESDDDNDGPSDSETLLAANATHRPARSPVDPEPPRWVQSAAAEEHVVAEDSGSDSDGSGLYEDDDSSDGEMEMPVEQDAAGRVVFGEPEEAAPSSRPLGGDFGEGGPRSGSGRGGKPPLAGAAYVVYGDDDDDSEGEYEAPMEPGVGGHVTLH